MKLINISVFIFLFSLPFPGFSQGEFNIWYFGVNAGISFNSGAPVAIPYQPMSQGGLLAEVSVSDSAGNILFYSNGKKIWNRNNDVMPNGAGLLGGESECQAITVQEITNHNIYYFFRVDHRPYATGETFVGLNYSVIDMQLDGGLGDIVPGMKNIPMPMGDSAVTQLSATRHRNNRDAWVVALKHGNLQCDKYLAYLIDSTGLNTSPVVSQSTLVNSLNPLPPNPAGVSGFMRISPSGEYLFCTDSLTEMCLFNNLTGVVTPQFRFWPGPGKKPTESLEFSIDSKYIYFTTEAGPPEAPWRAVVQYDMINIDSNAFLQSQTVVGNSHGFNIQMGPDGKIYLATGSNISDSLHIIVNPSAPGTACNYQKNAFCLEGNAPYYCLPQFLQRYKAYISSGGQCQNDSVKFRSDIWPPPDSIHWDFGDPGSGTFNYSNLANPFHIYSDTGTYVVECWVRHIDKRTDTSWLTVVVHSSPDPALGNDRTICTGDSATFGAGFCISCSYLWKNLSTGLIVGTGQTFTTGIQGQYEVAVTNASNCMGKDTVQLLTTPVPVVTNTPAAKTICSDELTNIVLSSNVPEATFSWTASLTSGNIIGFSADSGLVINQTLINLETAPGIVTYTITPRVGSCVGQPSDYVVTVNPGDSVSVSITSSENNICEGIQITFNATPVNGGTAPIYQWKVNGINVGTNSPVYSFMPLNGDIVTCVLTSSIAFCITNNPATSNSITMTVNPLLPVSVSISSSANPVCAGTLVTFTATPTNEGTTPFYQWKVNGINVGINSPNYSYLPSNGDVVTCILTSSQPCTSNNPATSNTVTMIVNDNLPAGVIINANPNPFCQGTPVTFGATPVNGGTAPSYQWKVNGTNSGTDSPCLIYSPQAGDSVWCLMTSNLLCVTNNPATSNKITMVEAPSPVVTFTRCFDSVTTVNAKPMQLKGGLPLGGIYSGPGVNSSTGVFTPSVAGTGAKTLTYSYTNVYLCSAGSVRTITVQSSPPFTCDNLTDIRDGKVYRTIQVGSKCWMGANLNYGSWIHSSMHQRDNCIPEKYCPHDLQVNCQLGTATYQWDELIQYGITAAPDYQGVCPPGWHIPSAADFQELIDANQGNGLAGSFLTDLYLIPRGFEALLQGMAYLNTAWAFTSTDFPSGTMFWTSTPGSNNKIITRGVNSRNQSVSLYESSKANAFAVRCVKD